MTEGKSIGIGIGIIGVGNIGASILRGLLAADADMDIYQEVEAKKFFISDEKKEKLNYFEQNSRVEVCESNEELAKQSDVIILAVKPGDIRRVAEEIGSFIVGKKILISLAAGVPTRVIETYLGEAEGAGEGEGKKVIRVMPNIASHVRESVSAVCRGHYAREEDEKVAEEILSAVGDVYSVKEEDMDVITGLSGSGIAFFAAMIDAMADGGVYEGLPYDLSLILSAKTALGAAKMILAGKKPSEIKEMTISPGGTTIRGLYAMEMKSARAAVTEAVIEATKRARELSKNSYTSMK